MPARSFAAAAAAGRRPGRRCLLLLRCTGARRLGRRLRRYWNAISQVTALERGVAIDVPGEPLAAPAARTRGTDAHQHSGAADP